MLQYMLDTNICIYVLGRRSAKLRERFNRNAVRLCTSAVVLAELLYGAEKSSKREENLSVIESLIARLEVLRFDDAAAAHYGRIRAGLEGKGRVIGPYDLMIAGHARSRALTLVTNNLREFRRVPALSTENWA